MTKTAIESRRQGKSNLWITPDKYLAPVRAYFGGAIPLDPATEPDNPTKALKFYTKEDDGLTKDWGDRVFINPPYSAGDLWPWIERINAEAQKKTEIILLVSATRFETNLFQGLMPIEEQNAECFVKQRIKFMKASGSGESRTYEEGGSNTQPSVFYGFNVKPSKFCQAFNSIGFCRKVQNFVDYRI